MAAREPRSIAGGAGGAAEAASRLTVAPRATVRAAWLGQALENERVLGFLLLSPTVVLLGLFIAYPFVKGVWISLTNATVGNPGVPVKSAMG